MLEAYSTNITVEALSALPFNSTSLIKGCTATHPSADTFNLNKCGVYMVAVDATAEDATTIQLVKDGVVQPQAQATGGAVSFTTLVQVDKNNSPCCACESPVSLQVTSDTATTFTNCNITITKIV